MGGEEYLSHPCYHAADKMMQDQTLQYSDPQDLYPHHQGQFYCAAALVRCRASPSAGAGKQQAQLFCSYDPRGQVSHTQILDANSPTTLTM